MALVVKVLSWYQKLAEADHYGADNRQDGCLSCVPALWSRSDGDDDDDDDDYDCAPAAPAEGDNVVDG